MTAQTVTKCIAALLLTVSILSRPMDAKPIGVVQIKPLGNNKVSGKFELRPTSNGLILTGQLSGLTPSSNHGFHIHECGDCSAIDGTSAGSHFNPTGQKHGGFHLEEHHAGDLGNIQTDPEGDAFVTVLIPNASLLGDYGVIGRSIIIHAKEDDFTTQPSGGSGGRIGCGIIGLKP
ncbi:superoxide dismutase family protein [bacterium]|nr:superoxide dismutase family protein [bacterium]